jgi:hypothetical protein
MLDSGLRTLLVDYLIRAFFDFHQQDPCGSVARNPKVKHPRIPRIPRMTKVYPPVSETPLY